MNSYHSTVISLQHHGKITDDIWVINQQCRKIEDKSLCVSCFYFKFKFTVLSCSIGSLFHLKDQLEGMLQHDVFGRFSRTKHAHTKAYLLLVYLERHHNKPLNRCPRVDFAVWNRGLVLLPLKPDKNTDRHISAETRALDIASKYYIQQYKIKCL